MLHARHAFGSTRRSGTQRCTVASPPPRHAVATDTIAGRKTSELACSEPAVEANCNKHEKNLRQPSHIRCAVRETSPHRSCIPILARHYFLRQICASKDSFELVFHLMSPQNETNSSSLPSPVGYTALSTLLQLRIYFQPRCFFSVFL